MARQHLGLGDPGDRRRDDPGHPVRTGAGPVLRRRQRAFRDAENIVELLLLLATWASPVLYYWTMVADVLPDWLVQVYMLNPITQAVELFHYAFWNPITDTTLPVPPMLGINTLWTFLIVIVTVAVGQSVFRRLEGRFAQDL